MAENQVVTKQLSLVSICGSDCPQVPQLKTCTFTDALFQCIVARCVESAVGDRACWFRCICALLADWWIGKYTGCPRRKGPNFGRVFLKSNYTDITQNTYIQSWTVTEILNIEKWGLVWCLRITLCPWRHIRRIRSCIPTLSLDAAHCNLG